MTIKAVFFDLDDTLHDHLYPFTLAIQKTFPLYADKIEPESLYKKFRHFSDILWKNYSQQKLSLEELRIQRIIKAFNDFGIEILREQAGCFQKQYELESHHLQLFPEVPELLEKLKTKGYTIGIITNGPVEHQFHKITTLGLTDYIPRNLLFISDAVGIAKPNPGIFDFVAKETGFSPAELVYIGDTWVNDIVAANEAGWSTIWYNHRKRKPETNHIPLAEIHHLSSVIPLLHKTNA